jgi:hypothetical protein
MRVATLEDRDKLEAWCNGPTCPKIGKEFPFLWRRNQNWDADEGRNRPTVAFLHEDTCACGGTGKVEGAICQQGKVIGFHGTSYTKSGYANLYYVVVDTEFKRGGLGKQLIQNSIKRGHALGMTRWTNKSHIGSDGENFFSKHLGIQALAIQGDQLVYDWSLEGINTIDDIKNAAAAGTLLKVEQIPDRKLKQYQRYLDKLIVPIPGFVLERKDEQSGSNSANPPAPTSEVANSNNTSTASQQSAGTGEGNQPVPNSGTAEPAVVPCSDCGEPCERVEYPNAVIHVCKNTACPAFNFVVKAENKGQKSVFSTATVKKSVVKKPKGLPKPSKNCQPELPINYGDMSKKKVVVMLVGGSCSGKTTLRRLFTSQDVGTEKHSFMKDCFWALRYTCCGQQFDKKEFLEQHTSQPGNHNPVKGIMAPYEVKYTLFSNNTAICGYNGAKKQADGNFVPGTGADSNGNTEANMYAFDHCVAERDLIIYDGVMLSEKFINHLQNHPYKNLSFLWAHLDVSEAGVLQRLKTRREGNGEEPASEKTQKGVLAYRLTAIKNWEKATKLFTRQPNQFIVIPEGPTPEQIFEQLKPEVEKAFRG